jgi:hypothetical protein
MCVSRTRIAHFSGPPRPFFAAKATDGGRQAGHGAAPAMIVTLRNASSPHGRAVFPILFRALDFGRKRRLQALTANRNVTIKAAAPGRGTVIVSPVVLGLSASRYQEA